MSSNNGYKCLKNYLSAMMWHQLINIIVHSSNYDNKAFEEKL